MPVPVRRECQTALRSAFWLAACLGVAHGATGPAAAQSFDCSKARPPVETAICGSPRLADLDQKLAAVYGRVTSALASDATQLQQLRTAQRDWVAARNRSCGSLVGTRLESCLSESYQVRLAAVEVLASRATAAEQVPGDPALPQAALARTTVSASGQGEALVEVKSPGRFSISVKSSTGVALQIVDMIAGPGELAGDSGSRDGRLDVLLDKGTYKLRTFGAKEGKGDAALFIEPFRPAAASSRELLRGGEAGGALTDLQQRSYWIIVDKSQRISVEAIGRSLQDLRAWRNGIDLAELTPSAATVETRPGLPMTSLRLDGALEPGLYLVTAYGGALLPWANGDPAQPFHVRSGPPPVVAGGWFEGSIGPFGSVRLQIPAPASYLRLDLPEPAAVRLSTSRGSGVSSAAISRNSREPTASLNVATSGRNPAVVDVSGFEGQTFRLRALQPASSLRVDTAGQHLVSVDVAGEGGDDVPAMALLARFERNTATVLSSSAPRITPGTAWRKRFNFRGSTTLLFEVTSGGPVAATLQGPPVRASLSRLLSGRAPQVDARNPLVWDIEPGWYMLRLDPQTATAGVLDVTFGQPGLTAELQTSGPPRTTIDLGLHNFDRTAYYQVFVNNAPQLVTGPRAWLLPADLSQSALVVAQPDRDTAAANAAIAPAPIEVSPPPAPAPVVQPSPAKPTASVPAKQVTPPKKPAPAKPVVAKPQPQPLPASPAPVSLPAQTATRDGSLLLPVVAPAGGRISVTDATGAAIDVTRTAETVEKDVRRLLITVPASDKPRTVVIAHVAEEPPVPLPPVEAQQSRTVLTATEPYFFNLDEDGRRSFSLDVPDGGLYRIETQGRLVTDVSVSTSFLPRLDTAKDNGAGRNALLQTYLRAGNYRVDAKVSESSGRLALVARPAPLIDAGLLVAGASARATMEAGSGATFGLDIAEAGTYRIDLYGLGRVFTARLEDAEGWPLMAPGKLDTRSQELQPGLYRLVVLPETVDARVVARLEKEDEPHEAVGHGPHPLAVNDSVTHEWREPAWRDAPRSPDRWTFELQGNAHVKLDVSDGMAGDLLVEGNATPVAKIAYKRGFDGLLPEGRYTLETRALGRNDRLDYTLTFNADEMQPGVARLVNLPASVPFAIAQERVVSLTSFGRKELTGTLRNERGDVVERFTGRTDDWNIALSRLLPSGAYRLDLSELTAKVDVESRASRDDEDSDSSPTEAGTDAIELHLDLPSAAPVADLKLGETARLEGPQVHRMSLPAADTGTLVLVGAQASAELVLAVERQQADGSWRLEGSERGRSPVLAFEADGRVSQPWRVAVWSLDGGRPTIRVAAQTLSPNDQALGEIALGTQKLGALDTAVQVASVKVPSRQSVQFAGEGFVVGSRPGRPLAQEDAGVQAVQSERLWVMSRAAQAPKFRVEALKPDGPQVALALRPGDTALLPSVSDSSDKVTVWRAQSSFGQPGIDAGRGMGVAAGSAVALAGEAATVRVWNAGAADGLRLGVDHLRVSLRATSETHGSYATLLPPGTAQRVRVPDGIKQFRLSLAPGTLAHLSGGSRDATVWTGDAPLSRQMTGAWTEATFINVGAAPAPVDVNLLPVQAEAALVAGQVMKRFFGAAGQISLPVHAAAGDRLVVAGGEAMFLVSDGRVLRGRSFEPGSDGELIIDHGVGLSVAWIENERATPWASTQPQAAQLPQSMALNGSSKSIGLRAEAPMLLTARTTAPVIVGLRRGTVIETPELYASGAEFHRYLAAGDAELRLYSPQDGPLTGDLQLSSTPIIPVQEGLGEDTALAPGASLVFGFEVKRAGNVGFGLRSTPDRASARLLDASGTVIAEGVAQMRRLEPGRYLLEARAPADGETLTVRPAVIGITPPDNGPPPDVARRYLELVGLTPNRSR